MLTGKCGSAKQVGALLFTFRLVAYNFGEAIKRAVQQAPAAPSIDNKFTFTAGYQLFTNPADNAGRGPVSIFSGRLHGEF